jgi:folate-binding protein YgfZ
MEAMGYAAARERAAWFAVENGGRFRVLGPDAQDYLHRMLTNDIRALTPGHGAYACMLDINGRMIADLWVWLLDSDNMLVETALTAQDPLMAALDRYIIMEQVELEDARNALSLITVQGPEAAALVRAALKGEAPEIAFGEAWESTAGSADLILAASRRSALPGVDVYAPPEHMDSILAALAGAGITAGAPEALETLRIEAGIPKWGVEMNDATIPLDANLEGVAVSFSKGCYPGQEIIARIHSRSKPARHLMGLRLDGPPPPKGAQVSAGGAAIGTVAGSALSPAFGAIALAYMKKDHDDPGTAVTVDGSPGIVTALPF